MQPLCIRKSQFVGYVHLSSLYAWSAGRNRCLLVESRSPDERRCDEERSRSAASVLSPDEVRPGEFWEFERAYYHGAE